MQTHDKPKRAAIYVRVSKNREEDKAKPDRQIALCEHLAKAREYEMVMTTDADGNPSHFVDDDVSAYTGGKRKKKDRPRYAELLAMIERGEIDVIVALHMDRVLRSTREMLEFIDLAREHDATLATVQSETLDLSTSAGRLVATILAAVAQTESERKSERHLIRNEDAAAKGLPVGMAGFGFGEDVQMTDHQEKPVLNEDGSPRMIRKETGALHVTEGPLLRDAIERVIAGSTIHSICAEWNKQGVLTRQGKQWAHTQLRRVLLRPRNAGLVERKGAVLDGIAGQWTPVCSVEEFEQIKSRLGTKTRKREPRKHVLTGILRCQKCGGEMAGGLSSRVHDGTRYAYVIYRCKAADGLKGTFCGITIRAEKAEQIVRHAVRSRLVSGGADAILAKPSEIKEAMVLRDQRGEHYAHLDGIENLVGEGKYPVPKFKRVQARVDAEIAVLDARIAKIESENAFAKLLRDRIETIGERTVAEDITDHSEPTIFEHVADVGLRFDALNLDERRMIVRGMFRTIEVSPALTSRDDPYTRMHFTLTEGHRFELGEEESEFYRTG